MKNQYKQKGSWYKVKNPPGHDVGHRVRGVHGNFKLETSRDNRRRGGKFERGTNAYKPKYKPTTDKGSHIIIPGIQSATASLFQVSTVEFAKDIDVNKLLDLRVNKLSPGNQFVDWSGDNESKCTPEELIKLVPQIELYFGSSKNIERFTSNTFTIDQIPLDTPQGKRKVVALNGAWLHNNKIHWGYAIKWKRKQWGWHIGSVAA